MRYGQVCETSGLHRKGKNESAAASGSMFAKVLSMNRLSFDLRDGACMPGEMSSKKQSGPALFSLHGDSLVISDTKCCLFCIS